MAILHLILMTSMLQITLGAPLDGRKPKSLYFDYEPNNAYIYDNLDLEDSDGNNYENENDIARTITRTKNGGQKVVPGNGFNSPIYYIALPPQPYIFVPGMGYMSQPPPSSVGNFLNIPVNFLANGKPSNIYQWSGNPFQSLDQERPTTQKPMMERPKPTDSSIINLNNKFTFNGKPSDTISVLRDSYNALYGDVLQNFYP